MYCHEISFIIYVYNNQLLLYKAKGRISLNFFCIIEKNYQKLNFILIGAIIHISFSSKKYKFNSRYLLLFYQLMNKKIFINKYSENN